jgi:hypothetical protein
MIEPIGDREERSRLAAHDLARVREAIVDGMNLQRHGASLPCLKLSAISRQLSVISDS